MCVCQISLTCQTPPLIQADIGVHMQKKDSIIMLEIYLTRLHTNTLEKMSRGWDSTHHCTAPQWSEE